MIGENELVKIKEAVEELLQKMTIIDTTVSVKKSAGENNDVDGGTELVDIDINAKEDPQMLIGHNGQTLFELNRLLRIIVNKKLSRDAKSSAGGQKSFYINVDINDYKKQKIQYLKDLALTMANEAALTKEKKVLPPMPAYERKIIHEQLSLRQDIVTESHGEGEARYIIIGPR